MKLCKWVELTDSGMLQIDLRYCAKAREILRKYAGMFDNAVENEGREVSASRTLIDRLDTYDILADPQCGW